MLGRKLMTHAINETANGFTRRCHLPSGSGAIRLTEADSIVGTIITEALISRVA